MSGYCLEAAPALRFFLSRGAGPLRLFVWNGAGPLRLLVLNGAGPLPHPATHGIVCSWVAGWESGPVPFQTKSPYETYSWPSSVPASLTSKPPPSSRLSWVTVPSFTTME